MLHYDDEYEYHDQNGYYSRNLDHEDNGLVKSLSHIKAKSNFANDILQPQLIISNVNEDDDDIDDD